MHSRAVGRSLPWPLIRILALLAALALAGLLRPGPAHANPLTPTLQQPGRDAVLTGLNAPPLGVPTLVWGAVPGATRYHVQISQSQGFANPLEYTTYATSLTPTLAMVDGVYYWHVRAEIDRAWQEFSEVWSFSKDWGAGGTLKPVLLAPANDPDGVTPLLGFAPDHFRWEPVPGAARYRFEISRSSSFSIVEYTAYTLAPQHMPTKRLENSPYFWRVTPLDEEDNPGAAGDIWSFRIDWSAAPQPLAPEPDVALRFLPRFSWTAVEGAQGYILEISTQNDFSSPTAYTTSNTDFTPSDALANNKDYYWRVKAVIGSGRQLTASPPSAVRRFVTAWNQPPQLLTPANNTIRVTYPYFSWTPVPGAERYRIQIDDDIAFGRPLADEKVYNATAYTQPEWREFAYDKDVFWRVQAIDARGNTTDWTVPFMFRFSSAPPPNLVYPLPYYTPDADLPVRTERTIAWPVFVWDTTHAYLSGNGPASFIMPDYYVLSVAEDPSFAAPLFTVETAGLAAAPTLAQPFNNLQDGKFYFWRVQAMKGGVPMSATSITWQTRIDRRVPQLPFAPTATPIHPEEGFEAVAVAPVLGWLPVQNAAAYQVQVSRGPEFREDALVDTADALFPYYVPGQGSKTPLPFGTYWWRVRAKDGGGAVLGDWSAPRHFNLSRELMTGNPIDYATPTHPATLLSGAPLYDPAFSLAADGDAATPASFDVGSLHIVQDRSHTYPGGKDQNYYWSLAFGVSSTVAEPVSYGIYFDIDHQPDKGAPGDPRGKSITTHTRYRPDYAIYIDRSGDSLNAFFYTWNGSSWDFGPPLINIGGKIWFDATTSAVQVMLPYTALVNEWNAFAGSLAVTVFSLGSSGGLRDAAPQQGSMLDNPAFVSDMLMPLYPFDTPLDNPFVFHEMPSVRWRMPAFDANDGYQVQIARDADFTVILESWETYESGTSSLYAPMAAAFHPMIAYADDESYYWRVRVRHERYQSDKSSWYDAGPWSPPMRFKLTSYQVGNPAISSSANVATTPTFLWDRVEGAAGYTLQVGKSSDMKSPLINKKIDGNSYTPPTTLEDGVYYWRVAMRRANEVYGQWSPVFSFTKRSLAPQPLAPINGAVVNQQPTFSWAAVITNSTDVNGLRLAAPRYRLQWANNPEFQNATAVETDTTAYSLAERRSLEDGPWYWRVAMLDGDGRPGDYSPAQSFYKEYLQPTLIYPAQGSTPNPLYFEWSPLAGAAHYRIEVADNPAFNRSRTTSTASTRFTPLDALTASEYYWRVQMVDYDGKLGPQIEGRFGGNPQQPNDDPAVYLPLIPSY
ncbi:MAG: hypothetical protein IT329_23700 [Caldilineaceae bacterium]|nr:hypothetical protein [Caldilineaceae bacterium]